MQGSGSPTRAMEAVVRPTRSREGSCLPGLKPITPSIAPGMQQMRNKHL